MLRRLSANFKKPYEDTHTWGPLLITIGPHCSGKSSFVQSLDEHVKDHVIDDAPDLYQKVLLPIALNVWQDKVSGEVVQALKGRVVHDIPIIERLKSQKGSEQVILTLLFAKAITFKEFEEKMSNLLSDTDHDELFITCAKEVFMTKGNVLKTKTVDLFIPESVESATISVSEEMKKDIKTNQGVICWGNSNLNPDFYKDVLRTCAKYQRVVRFVRWGKELPSVPLRELFKRNITQYLKTGRYTESTKIAKFRKYAEFFTTKAGNNTHKDYAALAGYNMDTYGCVTEDTPANRKLSKTHSAHSNLTQWSAWTNSGQIFNVNRGTPVTPPVLVPVASPPTNSPIAAPVAIPSSPKSDQFATTNTSAAKTPAHGDHTKHFFSSESDHSLNPSGDTPSSSGKQGIAELLSDIPEVSENGVSRPQPLDISKPQPSSSSSAIPPRGKSSSPHSSPRDSRSGSDSCVPASPEKAMFATGERPALVPAASVAKVFMSLFSEQAAQDEAQKQQEVAHSHVEIEVPAPTAMALSPDNRKKSFMLSLFSHVDEVDTHDGQTKVPVIAPATEPHGGAIRQSSILSLFQQVEDPEKKPEPLAPQTREEVYGEQALLNSEEESNAAVFILDPNPPHEQPLHVETHSNNDHGVEGKDDERIDEMGFSKPEPLVHDHHRVFLQDSVKLSHQHPHTHQDNDTHNEPPKKSPKAISFKEHAEEIPVSVTSSNSNPASALIVEDGYAPAATQRPAQNSNPFSCILPAIFCGL